MQSLTELVKEGATFQFYRDGNLFYKTTSGFMFSIPVEDAGTGTFRASEEKAIIFMRWIRKAHADVVAEQLEGAAIAETPAMGMSMTGHEYPEII